MPSAPRRAAAPAPPPEPRTPAELAIGAILAASAEADAAAIELAGALARRRDAIQRLQRLHVLPSALLSKLTSPRACDGALAAAAAAPHFTVYAAPAQRRSFEEQARGVLRRHPVPTTKEA